MECPSTFNPADFFVHNLSVRPGFAQESQKKIQLICDAFQASDRAVDIQTDISRTMQLAPRTKERQDPTDSPLKVKMEI